MSEDRCDVLIVGAGPVGLLLGCLLAQRGLSIRVLEKRGAGTARSRAIGVHPPGLACLHEVGLAEPLIAQGVRVRRGRAVLHGDSLAEIDFGSLPAPFDFVLSVPQSVTEQLLTERLSALCPAALLRDSEALAYARTPDHVRVGFSRGDHLDTLSARYVVGCDGRRSRVRRAMNADYRGRVYRDRFAMADTRDDTDLGSEAVVFVDAQGLIESFPLPARRRRWVLSAGRGMPELSPERFAELIEARTRHTLSTDSMGPVSAFCAERFCAQRFVEDRLILAGDAAHVVSPIGGQGMNLGWLDAQALARVLPLCLRAPSHAAAALADYGRVRQKVCRRAARRAELYMALGFGAPLSVRAWSLKALRRAPLRAAAARLFTMQGLET
jgi:2-polyprenyl-6-methoxyphenol hydroxylase-like FAD-dependent oxidoreductase